MHSLITRKEILVQPDWIGLLYPGYSTRNSNFGAILANFPRNFTSELHAFVNKYYLILCKKLICCCVPSYHVQVIIMIIILNPVKLLKMEDWVLPPNVTSIFRWHNGLSMFIHNWVQKCSCKEQVLDHPRLTNRNSCTSWGLRKWHHKWRIKIKLVQLSIRNHCWKDIESRFGLGGLKFHNILQHNSKGWNKPILPSGTTFVCKS